MRRRSRHRIGDLAPPEIARFRQSLERVVSQVNGRGPHSSDMSYAVSWSHTCDMIVNDHAKRLSQFQQLLSHDHYARRAPAILTQKHFALLRERAYALLMPFFEYPRDTRTMFNFRTQSANMKASQARCKGAYLPWSVHEQAHNAGAKPPRHHPVGQAIEEVMDGICNVLIAVGSSIERAWLQNLNHELGIDHGNKPTQRLLPEIQECQASIEELMAWLGWAPHWLGCDRLCAWDVSILSP